MVDSRVIEAVGWSSKKVHDAFLNGGNWLHRRKGG